jgi:hypothetical protein
VEGVVFVADEPGIEEVIEGIVDDVEGKGDVAEELADGGGEAVGGAARGSEP